MHFFNMSSEELRAIISHGINVSHDEIYNFWLARLNQTYGVDQSLVNQTKYVSAMLTKFSFVPLNLDIYFSSLPAVARIAEFQDADLLSDYPISPEIFENAAEQLLFLSGFEEKFTVRYIGRKETERIGTLLFLGAALGQRREILIEMSDNFTNWQRRLAFLSYQLRKNLTELTQGIRFLIQIPDV